MSMPPAVPAPTSGRLWERARPVVRTTVHVGLAAMTTVAVNVVVLLIALPIGLLTDRLLWSVAIAEGALLMACLGTGAVLAARRRRGLGAGVVLGWIAGYVGLLAVVVALVLLAAIAALVLVALMFLGYAIAGL
jgi:hypothetical protein